LVREIDPLAHGGYGYRVTQPSEIKGAVKQALKH